jgi:hypothetical protein
MSSDTHRSGRPMQAATVPRDLLRKGEPESSCETIGDVLTVREADADLFHGPGQLETRK